MNPLHSLLVAFPFMGAGIFLMVVSVFLRMFTFPAGTSNKFLTVVQVFVCLFCLGIFASAWFALSNLSATVH